MSNIAKDLQHLARPVSELKPDPNNANTHPERNLRSIERSLKKFGQQKPIVILNDGTVIAGNGTLEAAKRLKWKELAASEFDSREDAVAFAIADNKTGQLAAWDFEVLAEQLREMDEATRLDTGFADFEIDPLLAAEWTPPPIAPLPDRATNHNVSLDKAQWEVFNRTVDKAAGDSKMTRGEALVLICQAYLGEA